MSTITTVLTIDAKGCLTTLRQCGHRDRNENEAPVMLTIGTTMKIEENTKITLRYGTVYRTGTEKGFERPVSHVQAFLFLAGIILENLE